MVRKNEEVYQDVLRWLKYIDGRLTVMIYRARGMARDATISDDERRGWEEMSNELNTVMKEIEKLRSKYERR